MVEPKQRIWAFCDNLREAQIRGSVPWRDVILDLHGVIVFEHDVQESKCLLFVPEYDSRDSKDLAFRCADLWGQAMISRGDCVGYELTFSCGSTPSPQVGYPHIVLTPFLKSSNKDQVDNDSI